MKKINTTQNTAKRLTDGEIDAGISRVADILGNSPKYTVCLPLVEGKPSAAEICYNGYVIRIKCGVSVDVPEAIYMLLKQSGRI